MIKYTAPAKEEPAVGLSEHTDINYLTILCQNEVQGLKIITKEGEWIPVDPGNDYFVVFVGESLKAWSNGRLHPPLHQVVFRGLKDRLTCAVFLKPKPGQVVNTAPEFVSYDHPRLYKPFSYGEFHEYSKTVFTDRVNILKNYAGI
ncbi:uncharacterized protein A4U43_C06F9250 [Asparagus officinalis]|uniref:Fe2OG dioxygenase domain-containing protein n=1 Tax=Asparagus officinalis TaxID=4686 RepID=A0A5P1ERA5_ASPOF|nr:uncharacterized protein A4U43_C06F9250 [Asparagus officinalis]